MTFARNAYVARLVLCTVIVACALVALRPAHAVDCNGKIINPVIDVCWSCLFPIEIGGTIPLGNDSRLPDAKTDAAPLCVCGKGGNLRAGVNFSFWEPLRTAEIVRHPGCLPTMGGVKLALDGLRTSAHVRVHNKTADGSMRRHTDFRQVHWFNTPWLFVLEVLLDESCLEQMPWDLAYLSELDPLWDDTLASFLLAPEAALFVNPVAMTACAADCTAATTGLPSDELFWCSGCRGLVYPLTGWSASAASHVAVWELMAHRFAMKLSREGLLWSAHGKRGQCGPYWTPLMKKSIWRSEIIYPTRGDKSRDGTCCHPLGRTHWASGIGRTFSPGGEDGALLLWRRRDCCAGPGLRSLGDS